MLGIHGSLRSPYVKRGDPLPLSISAPHSIAENYTNRLASGYTGNWMDRHMPDKAPVSHNHLCGYIYSPLVDDVTSDNLDMGI